MSDQKEMIGAMLDDLATEVVVLEPGDLMTYGDVLSRLEQLSIISEGAGEPVLARLCGSLKDHLEAMILGEYADQDKGVEILNEGVTLGQSVFRNEAEAPAVQGFLAGHGLPGADEVAAEAADEATGDTEAEEAGESAAEEAAEEAAEAAIEEAPPAPAAEAEPFTPEDEELLSGFVAEALEHLESIEVNTLLLEDNPEDQEALNAVFRPFHTIKGVSGFLNLQEINHMAHQLENLLEQARSGNLVIESVAIDVILAGVDMLRKMIDESQAAAAEQRPLVSFDVSELEARIEAVISAEAVEEAVEEEAEPEAEPAPPLGEILVDEGVPAEAVEEALTAQKEGKQRPIGEILVHEGKAEPAQVAEAIKTQKAMSKPAKGPAVQEVKIDTIKLDNLLDMVGELVIAGSMVRANPNVQSISDRKLMADLGQLSRITTELQKTTMSMRMVPIKQTFQKMVRVVRDTAKKRGRKVNLVLEGEHTEIDRNMVEKFYDPLMHMVRNSVDHGIEEAEVRKAAGKPADGTVVLAAYHKGGNVCIEIRDDGKGLDREVITGKALENEIITEADLETMTEDEAYHLIFKAGFSTAEVVTEISGRGVGMDVVQRTIDELRGKVEISTEMGKGSTFTIALPLTLAIIDGMVVEVGDERFILPTISVAESLRPSQEDYNTVQGRGEMIMIRGNLLPLVRLHDIVRVEPTERNPWDALVVVVEHHGQMRCLLVDRLIGRQEVVIKSLGEGLKGVKVVAGGAIMGDGRVGLILDVEGVFRSHEGKRG
jgi:two-component system chemotaxis sensor kinase CheA